MDTDRLDPRITRTRSRALDAALQVLGEDGFEGATVERVAECAGVHKTTIYRHWPEREDLFIEVLQLHMAPPTPPETGDVVDDVRTMVSGFAKAISTPPWSVVLPSLLAAATSSPRLEQVHAQFTKQRRVALAGVLRRGVAAGQLRGDLDVDLAVDLLVGPVLYRRLMTHRPTPSTYVHKVVDVVIGSYVA